MGSSARRRAACDAIKNRRRRLSPIDLLFLAVGEERREIEEELTLVIEFLDVLDELHSY